MVHGDAAVKSRMCVPTTLRALFTLCARLEPALQLRMLRMLGVLSGEQSVAGALEASEAVPFLVAQLGRGDQPAIQVRSPYAPLPLLESCICAFGHRSARCGVCSVPVSLLVAACKVRRGCTCDVAFWEFGPRCLRPALWPAVISHVPRFTCCLICAAQAEALAALHNLCQLSRTRQEQAAIAGAAPALCRIASAQVRAVLCCRPLFGGRGRVGVAVP